MAVPSNRNSPRNWFSRWIKPQQLSPFELLSLLGTLATIVGIFFLIVQTNKASEALESSAYQTISSQLLDLNKLFVDKSELRPYFFSGKDLTEADAEYTKIYTQVISIADLQLDFFDSFWTQADHISDLRNDSAGWKAWDQYITDSFANSPIMCRRLSQVQRWYTCDFTDSYAGACPAGTYQRVDPDTHPTESCK